MGPKRSAFDEWLVTNGRGGYAFGTVEGPPARSYHGLLVVARRPPVDRTVVVAGARESAAGRDLRWSAGRMDGRRAVASTAAGDAILERTIWMADGRDTTYVRYALAQSDDALDVDVTPLVTERDHHAVRTHDVSDPLPAGLRILVDGREVPIRAASVVTTPLPQEAARGLLAATDALALHPIRLTVRPGLPVTIAYTVEPDRIEEPEAALDRALRRDVALLAQAAATDADESTRQLVLAADAFLVDREIPGIEHGRTVIAGYPWFNDWGRDTMIALPGLCLATGRTEDARTILRSFARFIRDGLIPNDFPDDPAADPAYHTIDASLWFVHALAATVEATGDGQLGQELAPAVRSILEAHLAGTRFGIGLDPEDGLLRGGADGVQLTWMDAKVDGWVVTPRAGKPIEIQALWVRALEVGAALTGDAAYGAAAARAAAAVRDRFWRPDRGYLADVVDGPDGDDDRLRPNQLLALALPLEHDLVDAHMARSVLAAVGRELATPYGLRSLAPSDPAYRSSFQGDRLHRDAAYHQGTVWTWLLGPYADALARWGDGPAAARAILEPMATHLRIAGLGSISEILEPQPPFIPRGCPFQAWGVAEVLRTWRRYGPPAARLSPGRA
jgi:glycogen debranching enzyme